jgi:hypothetical protein
MMRLAGGIVCLISHRRDAEMRRNLRRSAVNREERR